MATTYAAGQQIAVQGIPNQRLSQIAQQYISQNLGTRFSRANYDAAVTITQQSANGDTAQRLARVEELREAALRGKTPQQAEQINKNYDLALAYWNLRQDLIEARDASGDRPFTLPHLSARLAQATTTAMPAGYGGSSYTPAGAWRERAENATRERREAQTAQRRSTMTPLQAALDELPASDAAVVRMVRRANREALANGVNDPAALMNNMRAAFRAQDDWYWTIDSSTADKAMNVIERAEAIAAERGVDSIFVATAAEAPAQGNGTTTDVPQPNGTDTGGAGTGTGGSGGEANGDIPPAPGGPDNEPAGPYRGQEYPASNTPRGTVREAQLLFEALGPEYSTGRGNTRRFGAGQRDASAMDGIVGEMTDAAIRKFQGENNLEVTGALDEATMTKLREVVAARAAATGQGQATDVPAPAPAPAPAASASTPGADIAARAMAANLQNDVGADSANPGEQADDYTGYVSSKEQAIELLRRHLNLTLSPEQAERLTFENGRIHSPDILRLEQALNAVRGDARAFEENGNFDARLRRVMQTAGMDTFINAVFSGNASAGDSQVPPPGGTGNGQAR